MEIVVATPLRLIDLLKSNEVSLADVDVVVLDEADRMADDGFTPQVEWILRHCTGRTQTMLFSATLDGDVGHLIRHYLRDPVEVADRRGHRHGRHDAPPVPRRAPHGQGPGGRGDQPGRPEARRVLPDEAAVRQGRQRRLVDLGVDAAAIHGDLPQVSRERALRKFAEGRLAVLVATDVAARGLDIDDIGAVIHYDPAKDAKDYLHRSGRTARAGRDGWAVTMVEYNQHTQMRILQRTLRLPLTAPIEVFSNDVRLRDLSTFEADLTG